MRIRRGVDPQLVRHFGAYRYRSVAEGHEIVLDARGASMVHVAVGALVTAAGAWLFWNDVVPVPPAIAVVGMGLIIVLTAIGAATDPSRTLLTGDSVAFGEPRTQPDVRWPASQVVAVELHRPSRRQAVAYARRRAPRPWRVMLRNERGEHFPPRFNLYAEEDARALAAELAERLGAPVEDDAGRRPS